MPLKVHRDDPASLNLTPMIDVVFLLIIFFMVATKFSEMERAIALQIPAVAEPGPLTPPPERWEVAVHANGQITLDKQSVSLEQLVHRLQAAREQYGDTGVVVRGDAQCSYQHVADVLAACKRANISELDIAVRIADEL